MYEKLKSLLNEWEVYSNPEEEIPSWIQRKELWSIGKSIELTLAEMRGKDEYSNITEEDKEILEKVYNFLFLVAEATNKN